MACIMSFQASIVFFLIVLLIFPNRHYIVFHVTHDTMKVKWKFDIVGRIMIFMYGILNQY